MARACASSAKISGSVTLPSFKSLSTGLPSCSRRRSEIEQIIHQLKCEAGVAAVFRKAVFDFFGCCAEHRAQARAAAEEARGLAVGELGGFGFVQINLPSRVSCKSSPSTMFCVRSIRISRMAKLRSRSAISNDCM